MVRKRSSYYKGLPKGWWRWNIKDPVAYAQSLERQVGKGKLTPSRLKIAIEEDSYKKINITQCRNIIKRMKSKQRGKR